MATAIGTVRVLRRLLAGGLYSRAERLLERIHPADLGPLLAELQPDEVRTVVDLLFRQRRAAHTLTELLPEQTAQVIAALSDQRVADIFARLEIDDLLEMMERLSEERREAVRMLLPPEKLDQLHKFEIYPPRSAGRVMTTSYVALDAKMTAQEAIDWIRAAGDAAETILYLYVIDEHRRLLGVVPIRRLVAAPPDRLCSQLMIADPVRVLPDADQEEVAQKVARYDLLAIPVAEVDGTMLGVITVDDVIDVITEEATQDMYHLAGLSEGDRVFSPASESVRRRLPWMVLNLGTAFLAAWVVGLFSHTIEQLVALAAFLPVVGGMGGNGGIQALTVTTRGIALGEIEFSTGLRAVSKEVAVGCAIGVCTGALAAGASYLWQGNPYLGLVLFLAMIATMMAAGLMGAAVPLVLKSLRQDPALGAGVIVTTLTDTVGFFTFLGIATILIDRLS